MATQVIFPGNSPFLRVCEGCPNSKKIRDARPKGFVVFVCKENPRLCLENQEITLKVSKKEICERCGKEYEEYAPGITPKVCGECLWKGSESNPKNRNQHEE